MTLFFESVVSKVVAFSDPGMAGNAGRKIEL
jgi:hypothetical protein